MKAGHCRWHLKGQMGREGQGDSRDGRQLMSTVRGHRAQEPAPSLRPEWRTPGWTLGHIALPGCVGREPFPDGPGQEGLMEKRTEPVGPCVALLAVLTSQCVSHLLPQCGGLSSLPPGAVFVPWGFQTTGRVLPPPIAPLGAE